ncbi:uncharacterized protein [Ranitomeya imitator]|uniref:uncharacterized protein n=1 Tax=Ranitomeya imitator TaxID=111125 RepID=UPI0037E72786
MNFVRNLYQLPPRVELLDILEEAFIDGLITKDLRDGLVPDAPRTPCLYLLPKVHKNLTCPTGRPIVSGNGGLTENVAERGSTSWMCVSAGMEMASSRVIYIGRKHQLTVCYTPHQLIQDILRTVSHMDNSLEQNGYARRTPYIKNKQKIFPIASWIVATRQGQSDAAGGGLHELIEQASLGPRGNLKHPLRLFTSFHYSPFMIQEALTDSAIKKPRVHTYK